jgi:hypothetical protein
MATVGFRVEARPRREPNHSHLTLSVNAVSGHHLLRVSVTALSRSRVLFIYLVQIYNLLHSLE